MKQNKPSKRIQKKAQIETMGLLVVVILISIILFFALSFSLKSKSNNVEPKQEFKESQAISNFGTTMLETTSSCGWTVRELLTDCAYTKEIKCGDNTSCEIATEVMTTILDVSLNEWGYKYNLSINTTSKGILSVATGCNTLIERANSKRETTPFGTTHGSMSMSITTCK